MIGDLDRSWGALELRHLSALEAVAHAGSFRGAARHLGYSQSALSAQIAGLERIIGMRLIERVRGARSVTLTAAGELILESLDPLSSRLVALRADLLAQSEQRPALRVGIYQTASAKLLPSAVRILRRDHPDLALSLSEHADDGELLRQLQRGEVDVAFAGRPLPPGAFAARDILDDHYLAIVASDSPQARRRELRLEELRDVALIDHRSTRSAVTTRLPPDLRPREVILRTDDNSTVHSLVAAGLGVAILPRLGIDFHDPRVVALPLVPDLPPRQLVLVWLAERAKQPLVEPFLAAVVASRGAVLARS